MRVTAKRKAVDRVPDSLWMKAPPPLLSDGLHCLVEWYMHSRGIWPADGPPLPAILPTSHPSRPVSPWRFVPHDAIACLHLPHGFRQRAASSVLMLQCRNGEMVGPIYLPTRYTFPPILRSHERFWGEADMICIPCELYKHRILFRDHTFESTTCRKRFLRRDGLTAAGTLPANP